MVILYSGCEIFLYVLSWASDPVIQSVPWSICRSVNWVYVTFKSIQWEQVHGLRQGSSCSQPLRWDLIRWKHVTLLWCFVSPELGQELFVFLFFFTNISLVFLFTFFRTFHPSLGDSFHLQLLQLPIASIFHLWDKGEFMLKVSFIQICLQQFAIDICV